MAALPDELTRDETGGRIGPNAITRMAEALAGQLGTTQTARLFHDAGLHDHLVHPPQRMVDEREVIALHRLLRSKLGIAATRQVSRTAGSLTGDYLLAHRIPQAVQGILRLLPAGMASRALLATIRRHAWTFAGTGEFAATAGHPLRLGIKGCPICRGETAHEPVCDYYAATFQRLFRALVSPDTEVVETACEAQGADACRFEVRWRPVHPSRSG